MTNFRDDFVEPKEDKLIKPEIINENNKNNDNLKKSQSDFNYIETLKSYLDFKKFDNKYAKLIDYERNIIDNIALANQMIDLNEINCLSEVLSHLR